LVGNPLFHWSAMELNVFFGIRETLCEENAAGIRNACNEQLADDEFRPQALLRRGRISQLCTSDDWTDSLKHHEALRKANSSVSMLPSLRADKALAVDAPEYGSWIEQVSASVDIRIDDFDSLKDALCIFLDRFSSQGCCMADHGLSNTAFTPVTDTEADSLFRRVLRGHSLSEAETLGLQSNLLSFLGREYARRGWVLQLHLGAARWTSSRLRRLSGPAGGYACIGSSLRVEPLCRLLDHLERRDALPRTIVYPLNPTDFEMLASLTGSFAEDGVPGKVQLGPAWWYNDHLDGILRQLKAVGAYGLLGRFVGMTTDSRSLLSTIRHDYFRRILCNLLGGWVAEGSLPNDDAILGALLNDICYENANRLLRPGLQKPTDP
jgi:glucuronate isomerase